MTTARDLVALAKPRITVLVALTTAAGYYAAPGQSAFGAGKTLILLVGTLLIVGGANALNMYLEREIDGLAPRTRKRPLPDGRMSPSVALWFGIALGAGGLFFLSLLNLLTGFLGLLALSLYVCVYTPMKQTSPGALVVGAVPGALPPLMGWTAVRDGIDLGGLSLFVILFLWQLPHFLAISLYRQREYRTAGYRVTATEHGVGTAKLQVIIYLLALWPAALILYPLGIAGKLYLLTALLGGAGFALVGILGLRREARERWARQLFVASLLYLTVILVALFVDRGPAA